MKLPDRRTLVCVHIGAHKTGTTSIQNALKTQPWLLRIQSTSFDRCAYGLGKRLMKESPLPRSEVDALRNEVAARFQSLGTRQVIWSSEGFFGNPYSGYANIEHIAKDLRAILDRWPVRIVACVRNQADFLESLYQQSVKEGSSASWEDFLGTIPRGALSWDTLLQKYQRVFGVNNVHVWPFESIFPGGRSLVRQLFHSALPSLRYLREPTVRRNAALSLQGLEIARRCNQFLDKPQQSRLRRFLQAEFSKNETSCGSLLSREAKASLLRSYEESNRRLADVLLDATPMHAYLGADSEDVVARDVLHVQ